MAFKSTRQRRKVMMEMRKRNPSPPSAPPEPMSEYDRQAWNFLSKHSIGFHIRRGTDEPPPWAEEAGVRGHGYKYIVTLKKPSGGKIWFPFWGSIADREAGKDPTPYDVLANISNDYYAVDNYPTFHDFASEFGYEEDSRKAEATFKRVIAFSKKLQGFFTEAEAKDLSEIQ